MKLKYVDVHAPEESPREITVRRADGQLEVLLDGHTHAIEGGFSAPGLLRIRVDGHPMEVLTSRLGEVRHVAQRGQKYALRLVDERTKRKRAAPGQEDQGLVATMPGQVLKVNVKPGDAVKKGQTLVILEAMKMEHEVKAGRDGIIQAVGCEEGGMVKPGVALVALVPEDSSPT